MDTETHLVHMELHLVSIYACIKKSHKEVFFYSSFFFSQHLISLSSSLPHYWPCVNHFYCLSHISFIRSDSQYRTSLFGCIRQACVADNYHWVSQWEWVNVFVVRGDHVLKHLLAFQYVWNNICGLVCGALRVWGYVLADGGPFFDHDW